MAISGQGATDGKILLQGHDYGGTAFADLKAQYITPMGAGADPENLAACVIGYGVHGLDVEDHVIALGLLCPCFGVPLRSPRPSHLPGSLTMRWPGTFRRPPG